MQNLIWWTTILFLIVCQQCTSLSAERKPYRQDEDLSLGQLLEQVYDHQYHAGGRGTILLEKLARINAEHNNFLIKYMTRYNDFSRRKPTYITDVTGRTNILLTF
jgi:hypothetical protein